MTAAGGVRLTTAPGGGPAGCSPGRRYCGPGPTLGATFGATPGATVAVGAPGGRNAPGARGPAGPTPGPTAAPGGPVRTTPVAGATFAMTGRPTGAGRMRAPACRGGGGASRAK